MTRIDWGSSRGQVSTGTDRGVLYISGAGVAWNGLIGVEEVVTGGEVTSYYFDGVKTVDVVSGEDFGFTINAYSSPKEFDQCEGVVNTFDNQFGVPFGFSYRTQHTKGSQIHIVYNARVVPPSKSWQTRGNEVAPSDFSWEAVGGPIDIPSVKPASHLVVDTELADPEAISELEDLLYGTSTTAPRLPTPLEIVDVFGNYATLVIIDHGDGTWTAMGPDDMVHMLDATTFEIVSPTVDYISEDTYTVSSY